MGLCEEEAVEEALLQALRLSGAEKQKQVVGEVVEEPKEEAEGQLVELGLRAPVAVPSPLPLPVTL